jgi:hypothetical protein
MRIVLTILAAFGGAAILATGPAMAGDKEIAVLEALLAPGRSI